MSTLIFVVIIKYMIWFKRRDQKRWWKNLRRL